ncbi:MAG TPA: serine hydrolase [Acetobacteraceae bacterium]|nr:serine hydrolase [Acetobacteraceae bacterium]
MLSRRGFSLALIATAAGFPSAGNAATPSPRYPGAAWEPMPPSQSGWSEARLAQAQAFSRQIGSAAVVVVQHGAMVASWGETNANLLLNSARKSLLSALIGVAVANGQLRLDATMAQLGIDDNPPALTAAEKRATVRDLLEARSGVYHPANYETPQMAAKRPQRGSHPPGTFWYYNNWDFNTLGAIYEHAAGRSVFTAFQQQIATPLGMQDFDPAHCRYFDGPNSLYPAYLFFASARDLARFGLLYLRGGRWRDQQIIPAEWVRESTQSYSVVSRHAGYGYLWWAILPHQLDPPLNVPPGTYWALGYGGQMVCVIPAYNMVVTHLARAGSIGAGQSGVPLSQVFALLSMLFQAMPPQ